MAHTDSIGIELAEHESMIVWLREYPLKYQIMAKYHQTDLHHTPNNIDTLLAGLQKAAPELKLKGLPVYISLTGSWVHRQTLSIEGDLLRLNQKLQDEYIWARFDEAYSLDRRSLYIDYIILPESEHSANSRILFAWAYRSKLKPYLDRLKKFKLKVRAVELGEMSEQRFNALDRPLYEIEGLARFTISCGAALYEYNTARI